MTSRLVLLICLALLALPTIGCAGAGPHGSARAPVRDDANGLLVSASPPAADLRLAQNDKGPASGSGAVVKDAPHDTSFLIYSATLTMSVFQVEQGLGAVEGIAKELGGYLSSRADKAITVRVPRHKFRDALTRIEQMGNVLHRSVGAEDVTDQYVDMDIRLKNGRAMRDRLQQLLQNAGVKEALDIEKELARVTQEIEQLEGRLKLLRDRISYATITVSFQPLNAQQVQDAQLILPFPWLNALGLPTLLRVYQ
jgi:hypothetical protein